MVTTADLANDDDDEPTGYAFSTNYDKLFEAYTKGLMPPAGIGATMAAAIQAAAVSTNPFGDMLAKIRDQQRQLVNDAVGIRLVDMTGVSAAVASLARQPDLMMQLGTRQLLMQAKSMQATTHLAALGAARPEVLNQLSRIPIQQLRDSLRSNTITEVPSPTLEELDQAGRLVDEGGADGVLQAASEDPLIVDQAWYTALLAKLRDIRPAWSEEKAHLVSLYIVYGTIIAAAILATPWAATGITIAGQSADHLTEMTKPLRRDPVTDKTDDEAGDER